MAVPGGSENSLRGAGASRRPAIVPRWNLVFGNQHLNRTGLARPPQDQPLLLQRLHHQIHRWRRDAHGGGNLGFGGRIPAQIGVCVNEREITTLSRSEVSHDILSVVNLHQTARLLRPAVLGNLNRPHPPSSLMCGSQIKIPRPSLPTRESFELSPAARIASPQVS